MNLSLGCSVSDALASQLKTATTPFALSDDTTAFGKVTLLRQSSDSKLSYSPKTTLGETDLGTLLPPCIRGDCVAVIEKASEEKVGVVLNVEPKTAYCEVCLFGESQVRSEGTKGACNKLERWKEQILRLDGVNTTRRL